uniref:Uncharacterized protein n=1 Tax=Anopheles melas TaxID=34690 RepID=A0A182TEQ9_9DIPT
MVAERNRKTVALEHVKPSFNANLEQPLATITTELKVENHPLEARYFPLPHPTSSKTSPADNDRTKASTLGHACDASKLARFDTDCCAVSHSRGNVHPHCSFGSNFLNVSETRSCRFRTVSPPFGAGIVSILRGVIPCVQSYRLSPDMIRSDRDGKSTQTAFSEEGCLNSITTLLPRERDSMGSSKALCVSTCGGIPWPGSYWFTVSWSGTCQRSE